MSFFYKYNGNITPEKNVIFVFGSNPEGRHGAGSAKVAVEQFGAVYGQGEGLQGSAYALPTTELRQELQDHTKYNRQSLPEETIVASIVKLFECCEANPDKFFKVAYRNQPDEVTLCGYAGKDLMAMFVKAKDQHGHWPSNIYFSEEWWNSGLLANGKRHTVKANIGPNHEGCWVLVDDAALAAYKDNKSSGSVFSAIMLNDMGDEPNYEYGDEIFIETRGSQNPVDVERKTIEKLGGRDPIIVFYLGMKNVLPEDSYDYISNAAENFAYLNKVGYLPIFVPNYESTSSSIECINPVQLTKDEYRSVKERVAKLDAALKEFMKKKSPEE